MSKIVQQKISSLQAAEQEIATGIQNAAQIAQDSKLKKLLEKMSQSTTERLMKLGQVIGSLQLKASPTTNETASSIVKELKQFAKSQPSPVTDTNIVNSIQKLLSTLATDYSFAANIAYEKKQDGGAVSGLSESFESLQKLSQELVGVTQELFKKVGSSSSPESASAEKPSIMDKAKQAVSAAKQAMAQ